VSRSLKGDDGAVDQGVVGRARVFELAATDPAAAARVARAIRHPWYRCQALSEAAARSHRSADRLTLVGEALRSADEMAEPNRVVSAAAWPIRVLAVHGPRPRLLRELARLLDLIGREPHSLRRADGQAMLLDAVWTDRDLRAELLDTVVASCTAGHGWRRDRLLARVAERLACDEPERAIAIARLIETPRINRRTVRDLPRQGIG
jgi:hypothetical protein